MQQSLKRMMGLLPILFILLIVFALLSPPFYRIHLLSAWDFHFSSNEPLEVRIQRFNGLLDECDESVRNADVDPTYLIEIPASLGDVYETKASDDQLNHLRLAKMFYQRALRGIESHPDLFVETTKEALQTSLVNVDKKITELSAKQNQSDAEAAIAF